MFKLAGWGFAFYFYFFLNTSVCEFVFREPLGSLFLLGGGEVWEAQADVAGQRGSVRAKALRSGVVFFCIEAVIRVLLEGPSVTHLEVAKSASSQYCGGTWHAVRVGWIFRLLFGTFYNFQGLLLGAWMLTGKGKLRGKIPSGKETAFIAAGFIMIASPGRHWQSLWLSRVWSPACFVPPSAAIRPDALESPARTLPSLTRSPPRYNVSVVRRLS